MYELRYFIVVSWLVVSLIGGRVLGDDSRHNAIYRGFNVFMFEAFSFFSILGQTYREYFLFKVNTKYN